MIPLNRHFRSTFLAFCLVLFPVMAGLFQSCKSCRKEVHETVTDVVPVLAREEIIDIDSNVYHSVKIGRQNWLRENLKTTRFRNGDPIPNIGDPAEWRKLSKAAYCNYDNDVVFAITYGRLYNWFAAVDSRNICPKGWHVPSEPEWFELTAWLGGVAVAGGKLKEEGTGHWSAPNTGATNESDFTALPGGYRGNKGAFQILDDFCFFWTSSDYDQSSAWSLFLQNNSEEITRIENLKTFGFSVRCVQDRGRDTIGN